MDTSIGQKWQSLHFPVWTSSHVESNGSHTPNDLISDSSQFSFWDMWLKVHRLCLHFKLTLNKSYLTYFLNTALLMWLGYWLIVLNQTRLFLVAGNKLLDVETSNTSLQEDVMDNYWLATINYCPHVQEHKFLNRSRM